MGWAKHYIEQVEEQGFDCRIDKHVCKECIGNYAIRTYIEEHANEHHCDYCGQVNSGTPISVHIEKILKIIVDGIRTEWGDPNNEGAGWDSEEGGWQGVRPLSTWDIIHDEYADELQIDNDELLTDIIKSINDQQWCEIHPYASRPYEEYFYTWELFCEQVKYETRYVFFKYNINIDTTETYVQPYQILEKIGDTIESLDLLNYKKYYVYRGRTHDNNIGYCQVKDLASPPRARSRYSNRMSPAGISMFYGAFDKKTTIEEIRDDKKYVTVGLFRSLRKLNLIDFTNIPNLPSVFDEKQRGLRNVILFIERFVQDLSKPIEKDDREHIEYVPTQIVTEYFRRVYNPNNGQKVDGLIYPSSKVQGGICCVLFFENENFTQDCQDNSKDLCLDSNTITIYSL
jgi:hypothetical protein